MEFKGYVCKKYDLPYLVFDSIREFETICVVTTNAARRFKRVAFLIAITATASSTYADHCQTMIIASFHFNGFVLPWHGVLEARVF